MSYADVIDSPTAGKRLRRNVNANNNNNSNNNTTHSFSSLSSSTHQNDSNSLWAIGYYDRLYKTKEAETQPLLDTPPTTVTTTSSSSTSNQQQPPEGENIDETLMKNYIILPPTQGQGLTSLNSTEATAEAVSMEQVLNQVKSIEAGIVIALAKLQTHCSAIDTLQSEINHTPTTLEACKELTYEREQAVNIFNHIRTLFYELTQMQQHLPQEQQQWLEERFRPLFIDYGYVVYDFEKLCFPVPTEDGENTPLSNSLLASSSSGLGSKSVSPEEHAFLLKQQRQEQINRRTQRKNEIEYQLQVLADQAEFANNEREIQETIERQQKLERELMEINSMFQDLAQMVQKSASVVSKLEQQVEETRHNVVAGTKELGRAAKIQSVLYPVVFGLAGGIIGGPVGFLAGLKGGGLLGATAIGVGLGAGAGAGIKTLKGKYTDDQLKKVSTPMQQALVNDMATVLSDENFEHPPLIIQDKKHE